MIEISVKRVHAPGGIKRLRLVRNGFSHRGGGMFGYDSITVSYAGKLISVSICYSQGDGFTTSLSRLCTVPTSYLHLLDLLWCTECGILGVVVVGGMVMCYPGQR